MKTAFVYKTDKGTVIDRPTAQHYRKIIRKKMRDRIRFYNQLSQAEDERIASVVAVIHLMKDFEEVWRSANNGRYFR